MSKMQYGIYTIKSENEIPQELLENELTFYVKINGEDIKDYMFDYMDIMQQAFKFPIEDCIGNSEAFRDWMEDLGWLRDEEKEGGNEYYENVILVFENWNKVGKTLFSSGKKVREKILEDFIETKEQEDEGILRWLAADYPEFEDEEPDFKVFNIYLIP